MTLVLGRKPHQRCFLLLDAPLNPVRYDPAVEHAEKDEAETAAAIRRQMRKIQEITFKDGGHAIRSVHAKSHGLLKATFEVSPDLPQVLAQGLFAQPGRYDAVMRYSTIPGDILDDSVSTPRGLALKILGVDGERLEGAEGSTQDFVLVNGKAFGAPNAKAFLANLKLLAATTDKAQAAKKAVSAVNRALETVVEAFGGESGVLKALGGQRETHILGESFYSQAPILYGDYIAKIAVVPVSPQLHALTNKKLVVDGKPDGLREAVNAFFAENGGEWDVRVQLCTDLEDMPVENAHKAWPEDKSPYLPVGRITVEPQAAWTPARSEQVDDGMAFSPWHGLAAHRPLGSIMRVRRQAYQEASQFRGENNGRPIHEPRSFDPA